MNRVVINKDLNQIFETDYNIAKLTDNAGNIVFFDKEEAQKVIDFLSEFVKEVAK